jgi:H+-translocating NAD(P) transhydrogenase subunit alpha
VVTIGIPKERRPHEARVAASPDSIKRLKALGVELLVEKGAGAGSFMPDSAYSEVGAGIVEHAELYARADIVLKVQRPLGAAEGELDEMALLRKGQILVAMLDPYNNREQLRAFAEAGVVAFALELLPRTTRAQAMDVLSSQANLAGYRAVIDAIHAFNRVLPMMMTAAGTVPSARVFVIGAGVAGLQAIATARRLGAIVSATDVRPASKEEVESLGAKFVGVPVADAATSGGYAKELAEEQQRKQQELLTETLRSQDIVITTAQIPGRRAPRILTKAMIEGMKPGSVIVDLAVESGGNVEGSEVGRIVEVGGVRIVGHPNVPSRLAPAASSLYARNLVNFVQLLLDKEKGVVVNEEDDLVRGTLVTKSGSIVHPALKDEQAA